MQNMQHHKTVIYRVLYNVLRDYKNLWQENRRSRIYETCIDRRNNSHIFFPRKLFFILVQISAAGCLCKQNEVAAH
jgi:hypothetical protein